jgi:hypothetical protein
MKFSTLNILAKTLFEIAEACDKSPAAFTILVKLMVGENTRLASPNLAEMRKQNDGLIKQFGIESKEVPGQWSVAPDAPQAPEFMAELQKLMDAEVNTKFRRIYESDLKGNDLLTARQIGVLQEAGVLLPHEERQPRPAEAG